MNLLSLLLKGLTKDLSYYHRKGAQIHFLGKIKSYSSVLQKLIRRAQILTQNNSEIILNIALNYGGRLELVGAIKKIVREKIPASKISEKLISQYLYTKNLPDPDLIVRTSGELRLSGFLTWQSVYSELYFTNVLWPDFNEKELDKALAEYARRQRRFGR